MVARNKNEQVLLALLRSALWGEERYPFQPAEEVDWQGIYDELCWQTVDTLPVDLLSGISPELAKRCMGNAASRVAWWYVQMQEQQALCDLFQAKEIPFVILKGAAADLYYPRPAYRAMGDIDFIVRPGDYDRALQCMQENGYLVESLKNARHANLEKNGVCFELHRYFAVLNQTEGQELLDGMIYEAINRAEMGQMEAFSFPMLPRLENGLVILEHISQHLETGLGLRQVIDWMLYADKELSDDWYQETFRPMIQQLGLETLAVTVTRMCQLYLGLRGEITWCRGAEEDLCCELMDLVLGQGNFGRKDADNVKTIFILCLLENLRQGVRILQQRGCKNWDALQRYPWLKPFAWLHQIVRYIRKGFAVKHPLRSLFRNIGESRRQSQLMDRLGVTRRGRGVATPIGKQ